MDVTLASDEVPAVDNERLPPEKAGIMDEPADQLPPTGVSGDKVAEASWESFPASDAPSWNRGAA